MGEDEEEPPSATTNVFAGSARDVVQTSSISGGVHFHGAGPPPAAPRTALVRDWDPVQLGVHPAIVVGDFGPDAPMPGHVSREFDEVLRAKLAQPRHGVAVVLVGGPSTGKTRSMWEAVRHCLPEWNLVRPRRAADLLHAIPDIGPNTVLWLNETQRFLTDTRAEDVAVALLDLLERPEPVVVVGSMWPQHWEALTKFPEDGEPDLRGATRDLLCGTVVRIRVPDSFRGDPGAWSRLRELARVDPRLEVARKTAREDGKIAQVLSGGTALVEKYDQAAEPLSTALLTAAMDARRLGCETPLPVRTLAAAVAGYRGAADRVAPADWLDQAVDRATRRSFGIAALTPVRLGDGIGPADHYHAHDYLVRHGNRHRAAICPPASAWEALLSDVTDPADLARLARDAESRMLYRYAELGYRRSLEAADDAETRWQFALMLEQQSRTTEAVDCLRPLADLDRARWRIMQLTGESPIEEIAAEVSRTGDRGLGFHLVDLYEGAGRTDEAIRVLSWLGSRGGRVSGARLVELAARHERVNDLRLEAYRVYEGIGWDAGMHLVRILVKRGDVAGLKRLQGHPADATNVTEQDIARAHANAGELDQALELLAGDPAARLVLLAEHGEPAEAVESARTVIGDGARDPWLGRLLHAFGHEQDASRYLRSLLPADDDQLVAVLAALRSIGDPAATTEVDRVLPALRQRWDGGDQLAGLRYRQLLVDHVRVAELSALTVAGDPQARWALRGLAEREDELRTVPRYGLEADGSLSTVDPSR